MRNPETLAALAEDDVYRAYVEAIAKDYEAIVHLAIAARACAIAGIRFRPAARPFQTPSRPQSLAHLIRRIHTLVALCDDIERLAQLRAMKLRRERDADPLGLAAASPLRLRCRPASASRLRSPASEGAGAGPGWRGLTPPVPNRGISRMLAPQRS